MEIFVLGTLWFWVLFIASIIAITFLVEKEEGNGWGAFFTCLAFFALLYFFGSKEPVKDILRYVIHNPLSIVFAVVLYLFFGSLWSMVKWYLFLCEKRRLNLEDHNRHNDRQEEGKKRAWDPHIPKARDNKDTILMWMSWWPFSALWTLLDNPIKKLFRSIFAHMERTYDRIAERVMRALP